MRHADGGVVFCGREAAVEFGVVVSAVGRAVLIHQVEVGVGRNLIGQETQDLVTAGQIVGQDQVADEQPPRSDAACVHLQVAHLSVHLFDGGLIYLGVGLDFGITFGDLGIGVFHIGHVNIDHPVEQSEHCQRVVAAGVVDQRDAQPSLSSDQHPCQDLGNYMAGRDEVDIVTATALQVEHHGRQIFGFDFVPGVGLADVVVLAKLALQVAADEENRPGAAPAPQGVFLAQMWPVAADPGPFPRAADSQFTRAAIHQAFPRAYIAGCQMLIGLSDALAKFPGAEEWEVGGFGASRIVLYQLALPGGNFRQLGLLPHWDRRSNRSNNMEYAIIISNGVDL